MPKDIKQDNSDATMELATNPLVDATELSNQSQVLSTRGFFGIGIENSKTKVNLGTLWRSANLFNVAFIFTVKHRFTKQASDTMKSDRHIPMYSFSDITDLYEHLPYNCQLVGVELTENAVSLPRFVHPERAVYLLGAEDHGLTKEAVEKCHHVIQIPSLKPFSMNVAVAGSIIMYDRYIKIEGRGRP